MDRDEPRDDEDAKLVERALEDDPEAFERLFEKYRDKIYRLVYGYTFNKEDALDVTQDAFIKAYEKLDTFRGESSFYTWLCQIAIHRAIDWRRRQSRRETVQLEEEFMTPEGGPGSLGTSGPSTPPDPSEAAEGKELEARYLEAVDRLSEKHRTVFLLHTVEGLPYKEIAETLDIPIGTVMSRLYYARKKLREMLKESIGLG